MSENITDTQTRPYGRIDDKKLIAGLASGLSLTEAGIIAGSQAQRKNVPDVVKRKSEKVEFKEKLEEHIGLLQNYITEDKIATEDVKSLIWMLDKLCRILVVTGGGVQPDRLPIPIMGGFSMEGKIITLPSEIFDKHNEVSSEDLSDPELLYEYLGKKMGKGAGWGLKASRRPDSGL